MTENQEKCEQKLKELGGKGGIQMSVARMLRWMARRSEANADVLLADLANPNMGPAKAAGRLYDYASAHRDGRSYAMDSAEAARLLIDFYKLPDAGVAKLWEDPESLSAETVDKAETAGKAETAAAAPRRVALEDFL